MQIGEEESRMHMEEHMEQIAHRGTSEECPEATVEGRRSLDSVH